MDQATPYQRFLLDTRERLAGRFRTDYGSKNAADPNKANVYPYFIGVFDTVAALGSFLKTTLFSGVFLLFAAALGLVGQFLAQFHEAPAIGWLLGILTFSHVFWFIVTVAALVAAGVYVFTHLKWDFAIPDYDRMQSLRTIHFNEPWIFRPDCRWCRFSQPPKPRARRTMPPNSRNSP
jgi:hypothetical protein